MTCLKDISLRNNAWSAVHPHAPSLDWAERWEEPRVYLEYYVAGWKLDGEGWVLGRKPLTGCQFKALIMFNMHMWVTQYTIFTATTLSKTYFLLKHLLKCKEFVGFVGQEGRSKV
jgi:hypothetical protein